VLDVLLGVLLVVAHLVAILSVLLDERRQSTATLAWVLTLALLPGVGLAGFLLIGRTQARRQARRSALVNRHLAPLIESRDVLRKLEQPGDSARTDWRTRSLLRLGRRLATTPASDGNRTRLLGDGAATYASMREAADAAERHIHVEFYIVRDDETGRGLREALVAAARRGVTVRAVVDGIGSVSLPRDFWTPLQQAGGQAAVYRPAWRTLRRVLERGRIDFRNHRKLVVVDGRVGFTGGINIGREYLGLDPEIGRWRDAHIRIEGPAVLSLQVAFLEDWLAATGEPVEDPGCFPEPESFEDGAIVQVVDAGPDRDFSAMSYIHAQAFAHARRRLWLTNPYFVPNASVREGLVAAALRGVDVRLLLPARSDSRLVDLAAGSNYGRLLRAGVRIYHYEPGFLHAKTLLIDKWLATVGSANMDMRSFYLNYELNAFVFGGDLVGELHERFLADLEGASEVGLEAERRVSFGKRLARAGARLLSPLL
jgi:cardiolipin synthase